MRELEKMESGNEQLGPGPKNYMSQCFLLETRKSKQAVVIRKVNKCLSMHTQCGHFPQKYAVGPARKEKIREQQNGYRAI